jgi:putative ABC transport system permease protein
VSVPGYAGKPNAVPPDVWTSVLERVRGVRGVTAAGAATGVPMIRTDAIGLLYSVVGERSPKAFQDRFALTVAVTPGYFEAIGFRMLEGRVFDERDMSTSAPVAIVSRALADRFGGPSKILGKQLTLAGQPSAASIVGIAENVRHFGPETAVPAQVYVPHRHMPAQLAAIVVRHTGDAGATAREIRRAAGSANEFVIYDLRPMPDVVRAATQPQHLLAWVLIVFAAIALSLAGVATYAVTAQFIATRTREIAVRRALGAPRSTVMRLLMANGLLPAALGAVGGLLATFAALRALASVLPGMRAPVAIDSGAAVLTVLLMAAAACALSSTIAFRIDPAQALRE